MDEQVIDLGIKFMRGYEPASTPESVPGGCTDVAGSLAQTGDLNIAWIVGLVMLMFAIAGVVAYAFVKKQAFASVVAGAFAKNKQLTGIFHEVTNSFKSLKFSSFSLRTKIISAVIAILAIVCIICGCFSMNAHAADEEGSISVSPNKISAVVSEEGQITSWDPTNVTLTNTSTTDKFDFKSIKVAFTDEAKSVEALKSATIKITGFGGITVFDEKASDSKVTCTGLSLDKSSSTTLAFEIIGTFDISQLEILYDKQLFKISINAEKCFPEHEYLYQYTLSELQQVSEYLAANYSEDSTDSVCVEFRDFRDKGILTGDNAGKDNGVDMNDHNHPNKNNHWAIDEQGRIASNENFEVDCNNTKTIQARIIGICEDKDASGNPIGLTFMTTHALSARSVYEDNTEDYAKFGWAGSTAEGECFLQSFLNSKTASPFPSVLVSKVKPAVKAYQYSNDATETPNYSFVANKFWTPSMKELYGNCHDEYEGCWPNENEGNQYKAFSKKEISQNSYKPFKDIDKFQAGTSVRTDFVWSRSLYKGDACRACGVYGDSGGDPGSFSVGGGLGVVACFCI